MGTDKVSTIPGREGLAGSTPAVSTMGQAAVASIPCKEALGGSNPL